MRRLAILIALLLTVALPVQAFTLYPVNYTGAVSESGVPITGTRSVTLNVYDVPTGGSPLFTQTQSLSIANGVLQTNLFAPPSTWTGADRYIGVTVSPGTELVPRIFVTWVPMAFHTFYQPFLVTSLPPPGVRLLSSDQWTKVDSVVVNAPTSGIVTVSLLGILQWGGTIAPPAIEFDLNTVTPTRRTVAYLSKDGSDLLSLSMTSMFTVPAGVSTIYLWSRIVVTGQLYYIEPTRFQALFTPAD